MRRLPIIPHTLLPHELRDLADRVAREDGYRVRSIPSVNRERTALLVVFTAPDGLTFSGSVSSHRLTKYLIQDGRERIL